ncbi:MAG: ABC transporter substrate-binding protein [Candidatus Lambdaproteobacteria bacterium]|nr:ABC transporter substrate-binding protein [Candidatus Lambdaproteobacteria bacterium]
MRKHGLFATQAALALGLLAGALALATSPVLAQKYGGILKSVQRGNPASLSIHEAATLNIQWPASSIYNNLVYFDPLTIKESLETVIPELAQRWQWNGDYTRLTFKLHQGVKWHDGKPFTAKDAKHTFDLVRGVAAQKLKLNPRKAWYSNVNEITTSGDDEVTFHLKRPQPALVLLLASGYSPVYPAHVSPEKLRIDAIGTGPFKMKEYVRDQAIRVRKNPDYFVEGRPYLDGIDYVVITSRGTQIAALQSGQVEITQPTETDQKMYDTLRKSTPGMEFNKVYLSNTVNVVMNNKRPPFDNPKLRQAINMALDRYAYAKAVQPGYLPGAYMLARPHGSWGLAADELKASVPGFRDPVKDKEEARKLMRELGYDENKRFKMKITTRTPANYVDGATWILGEVKQIFIDAELEIVEDGAWYPRLYRRDYQIAWNGTGYAVDDPDAVYGENFSCDSLRNYTNYCDPEAERLFAQQSSTIDQKERFKLVQQIEHKLINDVARIPVANRVDYNARRNYVKNFVGHNAVYSVARFQDAWLDK